MKSYIYKIFIPIFLVLSASCDVSGRWDPDVIADDDVMIYFNKILLGERTVEIILNGEQHIEAITISNGLRNWAIKCDAYWISFSQTQGDRKAGIKVTIASLTTATDREADIEITASNCNITLKVHIIQYGPLENPEIYLDDTLITSEGVELTLDPYEQVYELKIPASLRYWEIKWDGAITLSYNPSPLLTFDSDTETLKGYSEAKLKVEFLRNFVSSLKHASISITALNLYTDYKIIFNQTNFEKINGQPYVDLGLPSGKLWAAYDMAKKFAWGETSAKSEYTSSNSLTYGLYPAELTDMGIVDSSGNLTPEYDAATQQWKTPWRIPTKDDFTELAENCTFKYDNSTHEYSVIGPNGNRILLSYHNRWSATLCNDKWYSYIFGDDSNGSYGLKVDDAGRYNGNYIRPVADRPSE